MKKKISYCYERNYINYSESAEMINIKKIFVSYSDKTKDNKLILSSIEWDENNKILKNKETIEDLECKMIYKINKNKAILYTKYGLNFLELRD